MATISVVINTLNEKLNIERCIKSVKWADEIIVVDMESDDQTADIARGLGATVFSHKRMGYVEPARNFAIGKASMDWILVLDADEEVSESLASELKTLTQKQNLDFVELPRKNIIFGKWMKGSGWWPDFNIRFFKKGTVSWTDRIHRRPAVTGQGIKLESAEGYALIHHHYTNLSEYLERMFRYTKIQADNLSEDGVKFNWKDLIKRPLSEFLSRFFVNRGFDDGLHGLSLSLLQAFSQLIVYLRLWEMEGFKEIDIALDDLKKESHIGGKEIKYWFKYGNLSKNPVKRFLQRTKNRLT